MSKVVCPYCFKEFERRDVKFRCGNVSRCKRTDDAVLHAYWKITQITGVAITPKKGFFRFGGTPDSAVCPECGEKSYQMICPHCHNRIPKEMVKKKGYIISIIGARSSGKTNYITTLINELMRHGSDLGDIGIIASNVADNPEYTTQLRYERDFFDVLYRRKTCPPQTDINDPKSRIPLIYEINQKNCRPLYLVFYDTAGENFGNLRNIAGNVEFLNRSDAVIWLLDTFAVPYIHDKLGIKEPIELRFDTIMANIMAHFTDNVSEEVSRNHFDKPMALVFSKIDAILGNAELFDDTSVAALRMEVNSSFMETGRVSLSEFDSISDSLAEALKAWQEPNFVKNILNKYRNYKYFGVSALAGQPDRSNRVEKVRPYRVLDPLVWVLSEFKYKLPIDK